MPRDEEVYYFSEFKKIDEGKISWNWCACLLLPFWVCYRKMYAGFLKMILLCIVASILGGVIVGLFPRIVWLGVLFTFIFVMIGGGLLGNRWYYSTVKHRIKNGYHLYRDYNPTSVFWLSVFILCPSISGIFSICFGQSSAFYMIISFFDFILRVTTPFVCYYRDDNIVSKLVRDSPDFSCEISEENISKVI